jgi:hypothetical protein
MSIIRKLTLLMLMAFSFTLLTAAPAGAAGADPRDREGDIRVCKVLKDVRYLDGRATFNFVIREKKANGERDRYNFDISFRHGEEGQKKCNKYTVDKGAYVVREKGSAKGYRLHDIDVRGCYYKDRNDRDAKVVVDVKNKGKCTVTFTNKKEHR